MKISNLKKFAWVFIALALGTGTLFAQGRRSTNGTFDQNNQNYSCVNYISGLTDKQANEISVLETKHQKEMDVLRDKRRSTTNFEEKDLIREEMLENVVAHRSAVKKVLNEDQQNEYDLLQLSGNNFRNQRGYGNFQGRGPAVRQGYGMGIRGGSRGYGNGSAFRQNVNNRRYNYCPRINNRGLGFRGQGYGIQNDTTLD